MTRSNDRCRGLVIIVLDSLRADFDSLCRSEGLGPLLSLQKLRAMTNRVSSATCGSIGSLPMRTDLITGRLAFLDGRWATPLKGDAGWLETLRDSDVRILAPLDLEVRALRAELADSTAERKVYSDGTYYWPLTLWVERNGASKSILVHVVQLKQQGVVQAAVTTARILDRLEPACVISFGIAGGFIGDDIALGDVVVAESVFYYEPAKEGSRKHRRKGDAWTRGAHFARVIPFTTDEHLLKQCRELWDPARKGYNVRFGPLASGEKLIADINAATRKVILSLNDKMLAVEMEAAGVAVAVREAASECECRFLVVKGISDPASAAKKRTKHHRQISVRHAAKFLGRLIREAELEYQERVERIPMSEIRERAEALCRVLEPWVQKTIRPIEAARILRPLEDPPPLFYSWRQLHRHVHWVDFHYLLVIKKALTEVPLQVFLLVNDIDETVAKEARDNIGRLVEAVLGSAARVLWYRDTLRDRAQYTRYAQAQGFDEQIINKVREMKKPYRMDQGNAVVEHWLQYMGWLARDTKRCICFSWHRHAEVAEKLLNFVNLEPLVVYRPDLSLDGALGKSHLANDPTVDPPSYDSIFQWLTRRPSVSAIADFVRYFQMDNVETAAAAPGLGAEAASFLSGRDSLKAAMGADKAFEAAVWSLVSVLCYWNNTFFQGWIQQPAANNIGGN